MTNAEFQDQLKRLIAVFGERAYPTERTKLIWEEVKWGSDLWFRRTIDEFIGSHRQPPIMPEFRDAIAKAREARWEKEREEERKTAKQGVFNCFSDADTHVICETIIARMQRRVNDEQWEDLLRTIERMPATGSES